MGVPPMSDEKKIILLVEDEAPIALIKERQLENAGYQVLYALDGEQAVEMVCNENEPVDLVVMDINLGPGMDGVQAAQKILSTCDIPIVFLSSYTEKEIIKRTEAVTSYGYVVKNNDPTALLTSIKMAFKLHQAHQVIREREQQMRLSESRLRAVLKISKVGYLDWDIPTNSMHWSEETYRLYGRNPAEFSPTPESTLQMVHPDDLETVWFYLNAAVQGGAAYDFEHRMIRPDGQVIYVHSQGELLRDAAGNPLYMLGAVIDITERKQAEEILRESEKRYRDLFENTTLAIFQSTLDGKAIIVNPVFAHMFGYQSPEEFYAAVKDVAADLFADRQRRSEILRLRAAHPELKTFDSLYRRKDGSTFLGHLNVRTVTDSNGGELCVEGFIEDITERQQAEEKIKALLREKELLLREVHHRVKNNMSAVFSLLQLQLDAQENLAAKLALQDAASRVRSMMILYDKLYRSENFAGISIQEYFPYLLDEIASLFPQRDVVSIQTQIAEDVILDSTVLSPLGIILTELTTNALKYAFPGRSDGVITVVVSRSANEVSIIFEDNGIGLPESLTLENSTGFGMQLVDILVKQIDGSIQIERNQGAKFIIKFEIDQY